MLPLPASLRHALEDPPPLVVGPVGVGFGQDRLAEWACSAGRQVVDDPVSLGEGPALLLPGRRSQVVRIPRSTPLDGVLVLEEADVVFDRDGWLRALRHSSPGFAESTFEQGDGWPLALDLSRRIGASETPLHQHPLAAIVLERHLPGEEMRDALRRAAPTPLLTPELNETLELRQLEVAELLDRGYFVPSASGLYLPRLLRRFLCPQPDPELAHPIAERLAGAGHLDAALLTLADAGLWDDYLLTLANGFELRPQEGEARLRRALARVPTRLHGHSSYLYLLGLLDRLRGEYERAHEHYRAARRLTSGEPASRHRGDSLATIDSARGIAFALAGKLEPARRAFGSAIRFGSNARLVGEARHNRAGVYIQLGRLADAEKDLRKAIATFRDSGDYAREARSLQLLALSWHQRGLLHEARQGYEDVLELLTTLGQPTALLRTNLAEVLILAGQQAQAKEQLDLAAVDSRGDARTAGYIETNRAMWLLNEGEVEAATRRTSALLRQEGLEAHLRAEAELLLARALRLQGEHEAALEHAKRAAGLGVGAALELALCQADDLDEVVSKARDEEARYELAMALLDRGGPGDLIEALELIRTYGYGSLLDSPHYAPQLATLGQDDPATRKLFPLRISTFGSLKVRFLGRTLTLGDFPTRKSAALLLRISMASRPLPREVLAEEFWSDAGNPLQSLQTGLYHLNRTLNSQVIGGRRGIVELVHPAQLDLDEFERTASETLEYTWSHGASGVRRAIGLADGGALVEFPEWFDEERRRVEDLLVRLWRRLAELEEESPTRSAEALEALLRLDPYDVDSCRKLIEIYEVTGELEMARRQQEKLRQLESEL